MVKIIHEVWYDPDNNCFAMFKKGAKGWRESLGPRACLQRTFEAETAFEAFQIHYRLMGYGEWKIPPGVPNTVYQDEDNCPD